MQHHHVLHLREIKQLVLNSLDLQVEIIAGILQLHWLQLIVQRRSVVTFLVKTTKNVMTVCHHLKQQMILSVSLMELHVLIMERIVVHSMELKRHAQHF